MSYPTYGWPWISPNTILEYSSREGCQPADQATSGYRRRSGLAVDGGLEISMWGTARDTMQSKGIRGEGGRGVRGGGASNHTLQFRAHTLSRSLEGKTKCLRQQLRIKEVPWEVSIMIFGASCLQHFTDAQTSASRSHPRSPDPRGHSKERPMGSDCASPVVWPRGVRSRTLNYLSSAAC